MGLWGQCNGPNFEYQLQVPSFSALIEWSLNKWCLRTTCIMGGIMFSVIVNKICSYLHSLVQFLILGHMEILVVIYSGQYWISMAFIF